MAGLISDWLFGVGRAGGLTGTASRLGVHHLPSATLEHRTPVGSRKFILLAASAVPEMGTGSQPLYRIRIPYFRPTRMSAIGRKQPFDRFDQTQS